MRSSLLLTSLLALVAGAPYLPAQAPPAAVAPTPGLTLPPVELGTDATALQDWSWAVGRAEFKVAKGRLTPVRSHARIVGYRIEGPGTFSYRSTEPLERNAMLYSLRRSTSFKPTEDSEGVQVVCRFTEATVWVEGTPLPPPGTAEPATQPATPWEPHRTIFDHLGGLDRGQQALLAAAAPNSGPWVWAEIKGEQPLLYRLDGRVALEESLALIHAPREFSLDLLRRHGRLPLAVSKQPLGRSFKAALEPPAYLTHVDMDLEALKSDAMTLKVTETLVPTLAGQKYLLLNLSSGRPDPADPARWRDLRVRAVTGPDGRSVAFHHARGALLLAFPQALPEKRALRLTFELEGDPLIRPDGNDYWELGTYAWFPQPELGGQYYTVDARLAVEKPFVPVASGPTVSRASDARFNRQTVRIEKPIQFFVVLGGKYKTFEDKKDGLTIRVHGYAFPPAEGEKLVRLSRGIIGYYERFLGKFPFDQFDIVEKNDYGYGQAPPGLMIITKEALSPLQDNLSNMFARGVNARFAHEIAHQYWGHVLKMPSGEEQWLTESFAEYCSALYMERAKGKQGIDTIRAEWRLHSGEIGSIGTIPTANRLVNLKVPFEPMQIRQGLLYNRGPLVLDRIRTEIGDDAFYTFLNAMLLNFPFKFSSTADVQGVLGAVTKKDWEAYFDKHVWGPTPP